MYRNRSYFWPLMLIGAGVLLLLTNMGAVESSSVYQLVNLWPLLLIGFGVNLMFGSQVKWLGLALGVTMLALAALFLVYAPQLDMPEFMSTPDLVTENYSEDLGNVESYKLNLDTSVGHITLSDTPQAGNLVDVEMHHRSDSSFKVTGDENKEILVKQESNDTWFTAFDWLSDEEVYINVELDSSYPANILVDHSSGTIDLMLEEFDLVNLDASLSSGNMNIYLPDGDYPTEFKVSSGKITLNLSDGVTGLMDLDISSGTIVLNIPAGLGVRIEVEVSSGSVKTSSDFTQVSGDDKYVGEDGTWENDLYGSGAEDLLIIVDVSSGSLRINSVD
jgi:hypothetical protein